VRMRKACAKENNITEGERALGSRSSSASDPNIRAAAPKVPYRTFAACLNHQRKC
jgi:hypothetical protein